MASSVVSKAARDECGCEAEPAVQLKPMLVTSNKNFKQGR